MRILLVNKFLFPKGGAERAVFDMAELLRSSGHEVAFLSIAHPENIQDGSVSEFVSGANYQVKHSCIESLRLAIRVLWNCEAEKKMKKLLDRFRPDIVHFHSIYRELSPSVVRPVKKCGIPSVMTLHDYALLSPSRTLFSKQKGIWASPVPSVREAIWNPFVQNSSLKSLLALLEYRLHRMMRAYEGISVYIAPSPFLKNLFERNGFPGSIVYLPNPLFDLESRSRRARAERKAPESSAPFVFVGRLDQEKGVDFLLDVFTKYTGTSPLLILGDGPDEKKLLKKAQALHLFESGKVVFVGRKNSEERDRILLGSKAILAPSLWYENQPYVIMEALSLGVPAIVSDAGALPDMIDENENGFSFRNGSVESLVSFLTLMDGKTPYEWDHIKENALRRARMYDPNIFFKRLLEIYENARLHS